MAVDYKNSTARRKSMVWRRLLASVAALALLVSSHGCYSKYSMSREEIAQNPKCSIFTVITVEGDVLEFEPRAVVEDSVIFGTLTDGTAVRIPLERVSMVYASRMDATKTTTACCAAGGATALLLMGLAFVIFLTLPGLVIS